MDEVEEDDAELGAGARALCTIAAPPPPLPPLLPADQDCSVTVFQAGTCIGSVRVRRLLVAPTEDSARCLVVAACMYSGCARLEAMATWDLRAWSFQLCATGGVVPTLVVWPLSSVERAILGAAGDLCLAVVSL